ncbi:MAG: hypothetical protein ACRD2S_04340 [Terriglobales bacterium]
MTSTAIFAADSKVQIDSAAQASTGNNHRSAVIPERVAALIRPILDQQLQIISGDARGEHRLNLLLHALTQRTGRDADEALVVLMCFYMGESQEETDAVIARGRKMLPLLRKYQSTNPQVPGRKYPDTLMKGPLSKEDDFEGAIKAIKHGWHSTADSPGE